MYLYAENPEFIESEFVENEVKFINHLNTTDYQNKELVIEDIDGRWLVIGFKTKN